MNGTDHETKALNYLKWANYFFHVCKGKSKSGRPLLHSLSTMSSAPYNTSVDFSSWESSAPSRTRRANLTVQQKSNIQRYQKMDQHYNHPQNIDIQEENGENNNTTTNSERKKKIWRSFWRYMKEAWTGVISGTGSIPNNVVRVKAIEEYQKEP